MIHKNFRSKSKNPIISEILSPKISQNTAEINDKRKQNSNNSKTKGENTEMRVHVSSK